MKVVEAERCPQCNSSHPSQQFQWWANPRSCELCKDRGYVEVDARCRWVLFGVARCMEKASAFVGGHAYCRRHGLLALSDLEDYEK